VISRALQELAPDGEWVIRGNERLENIEWLSTDVERPTDAEIIAKVRALHDDHLATVYQRKRREAYPSTDELVVALWESNVEGRPEALLELQEQRLAVKEKHPKPE